jgi:hypothetical protein
VQLSNYWIAEFLNSDFRTTSAAGTRRLAVALRAAAKKSIDIVVVLQASLVVLASSRSRNHPAGIERSSALRRSSRSLLLKDSTKVFCADLLGSSTARMAPFQYPPLSSSSVWLGIAIGYELDERSHQIY